MRTKAVDRWLNSLCYRLECYVFYTKARSETTEAMYRRNIQDAAKNLFLALDDRETFGDAA